MFRRAAIWSAVGGVIILAAGMALSVRDADDPEPDQATAPRMASAKYRPATGPTTSTSPRPDLAPEQVVRIVVEALAHNGPGDDGT